MPQLTPAETFPIVRVLEDHTDVATNYVQCIIRDAKTDAVVDTVNLTDLGNRRFRALWKVPYDNLYSLGRWLVFTTTVYTDSGYTTKNANYGEIGTTYLVQQRWNNTIYTGAGSSPVDYKEIRKALKEEIAAMPVNELEPIEFPEPLDPTPMLQSLAAQVANLSAQVAAINIPEPEMTETVDLTPVTSKLATLQKQIDALPKFEETDLSNVTSTLQQQQAVLQSLQQQITEFHALLSEISKNSKLHQLNLNITGAANPPASEVSPHLKRLARKYNL